MNHLILGAGNMVSALLPPFIKDRLACGDKFYIYTPSGNSALLFAKENGINSITHLSEIDNVDTIWLGMKPQQLLDVSTVINALNLDCTKTATYVSLLAGVSSATISESFLSSKVIRVMPNTPSKVGFGVSAIWSTPTVSYELLDSLEIGLSQTGKSFILNDESDIDTTTPYSGNGPAYFFEIARHMSNDLSKRGFSPDVSKEVIALTMKGAAEMMLQSSESSQTLRDNVTSKGGVTFEALKVFEEKGLGIIIEEALKAAHKRTMELKGDKK